MNKSSRNIEKDLKLIKTKNKGFWLYDEDLGYNVVMRAKTEMEALEEALLSYRKQLKVSKQKFDSLRNKVDSFLVQFDTED